MYSVDVGVTTTTSTVTVADANSTLSTALTELFFSELSVAYISLCISQFLVCNFTHLKCKCKP